MEDTITLEQLWAIFTTIKLATYGSIVEIRGAFVDTEMIFHAYQKEVCAQAQIGLN